MNSQIDEIDNAPPSMRLLLILEELAHAGIPTTPTEINQKLNLPKPTIHRLFATLEEQGFIQRDIDGKSYSPGRRLRILSTGILSSLRIRTARLAVVSKIAETIGETCNIAIPDRDAMMYLDRVETKWPLRIQLPVGTTVPFYCTASGKMYLSSLDEKHLRSYLHTTVLEKRTETTITDVDALIQEIQKIRKQGYSEDNSEFMQEMIAIAVPILDSEKRLVSTLSFHAPEQRLELKDARKYIDVLREGAMQLSCLIS